MRHLIIALVAFGCICCSDSEESSSSVTGAPGGASAGGSGGRTNGTGGAGAGGAPVDSGAADSGRACVAGRLYECPAPESRCSTGVQRCAETDELRECICAPDCGGVQLSMAFDSAACRVAFTEDPNAVGDDWEDALTVLVASTELVFRVEDGQSCGGGDGWYPNGARSFVLCPTTCAAVAANATLDAVLGCPTTWRADSP